MARARNIKPGVMENEELAELDPIARLLFIYLWMLADREGRLEDRSKKIKAKALPYDSVDADELLGALQASGFIVRYEVDGAKYIQITNFLKHQKPHCNETESEIPPWSKELSTKVQSSSGHGESGYEPSAKALSPCISDSLIAGLSDSLIPSHTVAPIEAAAVDNSAAQQTADAGESEDSNGSQASHFPGDPPREDRTASQVVAKPSASEQAFDVAWSLYPKRAGGNSKPDARKAWNARIKAGQCPADMIAGVKRYAAFCEAKGNIGTEFVKQAATFFGPSLHFEEVWDLPAAAQRGAFMTSQERNRAISDANMREFIGEDPLLGPSDPFTIDMRQ